MAYNKVSQIQIKTELEEVRTYIPTSGWFVAYDVDYQCFVGVSATEPPVGVKLTAIGNWQDNARYGRQFKVSAFKYDSSQSALLALLKGGFILYIRDAMAESVVKTLGDKVFDVFNGALDGDPDSYKKFMSVKGIGKVLAPKILESWREQRSWLEGALMCVRAGLTLRQGKLATDKWGRELSKVIIENPYKLTTIRGIDWETADRIAQEEWEDKPAIPHDSPYRYAAAVREALAQAYENGHVCLPQNLTLQQAAVLATPRDVKKFEHIIFEIAEKEEIVIDSSGYFYTLESFVEERDIAERIRALNASPIKTLDIDKIMSEIGRYANIELSPDQSDAVRKSVMTPVTAITGGAGVGKTTTLKTLTNIFESHELSVGLCAPTGKAAIRMKQATGRSASTIHRLLGLPIETRLVEQDVLIVDEASMMSQELLLTLLKSVQNGHRLILVGDGNQLPPVGAGEPFYQILNTPSVSVSRLTVIHRQGADSGIIHVSSAFNEGKIIDASQYEDCKIEILNANEELPARAEKVLAEIMERGVPRSDILLLTPLNKYDWGQEQMNLRLKAKYNPGLSEYIRMPAVAFDIDDPVIHTHNNYNLGVMNGEIGTVIEVMNRQEEQEAKYNSTADNPAEILKVKYGQGEDQRIVGYTRDDIKELKLAYGITIHKSQGSESPYVILMIPVTRDSFMLRQLAYTGLTRAKKFAHVISSGGALRSYVTNTERVRRYTNLSDFIENSRKKNDTSIQETPVL